MQINSNGYAHANDKALENATMQQNSKNNKSKELTVEEQINKPAVEVSLSMNAQIVLFSMDAGDQIKNNTDAQKSILNFLSGNNENESFNLANTGYEGKSITELSVNEAKELISDEGFFGISQTSQRVADFVLGFSGNDLEKLEKGREGIVKGFEEAEKMWGGELPQISYDTQAKTLELIDTKISELKGESELSAEE